MASVTKGKNEERSAPEMADNENAASSDSGKGSKGRNGAKGPGQARPNDLPLGEDDSVKTPDAPGAAAGKGAALEYRRKEEKLKKRTGGYFTIFKSGQGYWTRMGTVIGVGILGVMLSYTIYNKLPTFFKDQVFATKLAIESALVFLAIYAAIAWTLMNKPANVDFLIATDSEMKKVNWTSRKELMGSTQVVIIFMFLISLYLFAVDEVWGWLMYLFKVLGIKPPPFG